MGLAVDSGKNITTSSDGITWTPSTWYNSNGNSGITYGNGLYLASADENYGVSSDGTNWTYYSTGSTAISLESVVYGN